MIIDKLDNKEYLCRVGDRTFTIQSKDSYIDNKADIEAITEPTDVELIEIGKGHHPFYRKEHSITNINNDIAEIEEFELTLPVERREPILIIEPIIKK